MPSSLFERYGGFASVSRIVSTFYDRMMDSPVTSPYFEHVDMRRLMDHQTKFIAFIMGGPASYTNDHLEHVHARLNITSEAFDEAIKMLRESLEDNGVVAEDVRTVIRQMTDRKGLIVAKS